MSCSKCAERRAKLLAMGKSIMAISKSQLEKNAKLRELQAKLDKEKLAAHNSKESMAKLKEQIKDVRGR